MYLCKYIETYQLHWTSIGSGNGFFLIQCQAIIRSSASSLLIGPLRTFFREILIKIQQFFYHIVYHKAVIMFRPQYTYYIHVIFCSHSQMSLRECEIWHNYKCQWCLIHSVKIAGSLQLLIYFPFPCRLDSINCTSPLISHIGHISLTMSSQVPSPVTVFVAGTGYLLNRILTIVEALSEKSA